jgi:hypothetical protein
VSQELSIEYPESRLQEAESLLAMSSDDLFAMVVRDRPTRGFKEAKERYDLIIAKCRDGICADVHVRLLCTSHKAGSLTHLVCAVADTILHTVGVPVPAMAIAAIAVHSGIHKLCETQWH